MVQRLKNQLLEWLAVIAWKRDLPVFVALLAIVVLLQCLAGAYHSEFGGHPDEPAHYVTGLMVRDYIATALGRNPMPFAENYYDHYPKVALGNWPPMFYVLQAAWTLPFGVSHASVTLFMGVLTALLAWLLFRALCREYGTRIALGGAVLFLSLPLVQEHAAMVMTEIPITLFVLLAVLAFGRFIDHGKAVDSILFGLFAALGILTKGSAMSLALAVPIAILLTRRFDLIRKPALWHSVPVVMILAGPWTWKFRDQAKAGWVDKSPNWHFTQAALTYYPRKLVLAIGATLFVLALIGLVSKAVSMKRRSPGSGKWAIAAAVLVSVVLVHFIIPCGYEPRHLIPALPALMMFVIAGGEYLINQFSAKALGKDKARLLVWGVAMVAFVGATFHLYQKGNTGFATVAEKIMAKGKNSGVMLVSSDATGEGAFIAEVAMRDKRPGLTVRRASKLLASSSWSGAGYKPKFDRDEDLVPALNKEKIDVVITDDSMPPNKRVAHHDQLRRVMDHAGDKFELLGSYPMTWSGVLHPDAIRVYVRKH